MNTVKPAIHSLRSTKLMLTTYEKKKGTPERVRTHVHHQYHLTLSHWVQFTIFEYI